MDWQRVEEIEKRAGEVWPEWSADLLAIAKQDVPWLCERLREAGERADKAAGALHSVHCDLIALVDRIARRGGHP